MSAAFNFEGWQYREPPADPKAVEALMAGAGIELPEEYLALLRVSNGGGGPLGFAFPGWFQIWEAEKVLSHNRGFGVQEWVPWLFGFGSNGGGELLAFDTRRKPPWRVVAAPFIGMEPKTVVRVAKDFSEFLAATGIDLD